MKKWYALLLIMALACMLAFGGCGSDDDDVDGDDPDGDADGDDPDGDDPDGDDPDGDDPDGDDPDGDDPDGDDPETGLAGAACAVNDDCATGFCLTTAVLAALLGQDGLEVPNGYCSALDCGVCDDSTGGACVNAGFLGEGYEDFNICLAPCAEDADCRPEDSINCFDPQTWVDDELLDQATADAVFGDLTVCMPDALVAAAAAALAGE